MDKKTIIVGFAAISVIALAALLTLLFSRADHFRGTAYSEPYPAAPGFELTRADGSTFRLADQQGSLVFLFFGFTHCTDICPATMAELNQALNGISPEQAAQIRVVFVSVDPDRDTPQDAQQYVSQFNPAFIGLSGSMAELEPVWKSYDIFREVVTAADGSIEVSHTSRVMLIDKQGRLRLSYSFGTPVDDFVNDLSLLLK